MTGRTVVIIQARMTSTRLPGKVLADLAGKPALQRMIERVRRAERPDAVVVATTDLPTDDPVASLCASLGVGVFRGSETDVLGRFRQAAEAFDADTVMRLTADCPLIDPGVMDELVDLFRGSDCDYASNCNRRTYPDGLDVEVFSIEALREADRMAEHPRLREHVTPYIRGIFPDLPMGDFRRADLVFAADLAHIRWTVDRPDDLERVREIFETLSEPFDWLEVLSLATRKPHLLGVPWVQTA